MLFQDVTGIMCIRLPAKVSELFYCGFGSACMNILSRNSQLVEHCRDVSKTCKYTNLLQKQRDMGGELSQWRLAAGLKSHLTPSLEDLGIEG